MTQDETVKLEDQLFLLVPEDGTPIGNKALTTELAKKAFPVDQYWSVRQRLLDRGVLARGRGMGGSVYRLAAKETKPTRTKMSGEWTKEQSLYKPFATYIGSTWMPENAIDSRDSVVQITANAGSKSTGGKWTRPDVTVVSVKTYSYVPGRFLQVFTFEIKPAGYLDVAWVYEAASHSRFSHKTFLCLHLPDGYDKDDVTLRRLEEECARFGLGLMYFENPVDSESYETLIDPIGKNPPPEQIDDFIRTQLDDKNKEQIMKLK